jgi:co-chaperonin GroES (HSP10)
VARFSLKAIGSWVLVGFRPYIERKQGIFEIAPPKLEGLPNRGFVLAMGKDAKIEFATSDGETKELAVGDYVVYDEKQPEGFKWDGYDVIPVRAANILAIDLDPPKNEAPVD